MGLPALKHEPPAQRARRPHLRVVKPRPTPRHRPRQSAWTTASAFQAYVFFAVIVTLVCALGLGRVWLSVQAAQASIDSTKLRRDIKLEQYQGDMLEVQQSALATPSRIQAIAGTTMGMGPAASVSYLDVREVPAPGHDTIHASSKTATTGLSKALAKIMEVAASEARVLLVGDVGLASSR